MRLATSQREHEARHEYREPAVGSIVDTRYVLRRVIAQGGAGVVYEALHTHTRRIVAIKLLNAEHARRDETGQRLLREANALAAVRHPGFVDVLDAGVCSSYGPYLVLEMLEGRTLDGILAARQKLPIVDTLRIGYEVCQALAFFCTMERCMARHSLGEPVHA